MKVTRKVIFWIVVGLIVVTFWFGYFYKPSKILEEKKVVPVEVETVRTDSIEETIELTGWIKANQVVDIASKVAGRVESLHIITDNGQIVPVEEGLAVKEGQQLAVIDHDVYLAQVASAKAAVQAAEVELADAEREKKRIVGLYEAGSATEQSKDKAITAAQLAAARLASAKANLELAEINLRESNITSPIGGIVMAKHIDQGNLIRTGDRIVTIADINTVKIIVAAAEDYSSKVTVGTPAKVRVDAVGQKIFDANVYSIYPALDPQTHTIQAEIRLKNDPPRLPVGRQERGQLKPGMFARVTLITENRKDVVVIPRDVVLGGKIDEPYVYVVNNGIAHKRFVKIGITQGDRYEIIDGLKAGETLVVNGMHFLIEGITVEIVRLEDIK